MYVVHTAQTLIETNKKNNKIAEEQFCQERDGALKQGLSGKESWEKVPTCVCLVLFYGRMCSLES
jgi:hypothetical protein